MPEYRAESCKLHSPKELKPVWLDLEQRARCSYFQSWGWVGTWLVQIAAELQPVVLKVWSDKKLVGLGIFTQADIKRHVIVSSKSMYLNEYPFEGKNMVIEYNGLLAEKGVEEEVYGKVVEHLFDEYKQVNEFVFGAISKAPDIQALEKSATHKFNFIVDDQSISRQVDLEAIKPGLDNFLATLSRNSKQQIRRSLKLYQEKSPVKLAEASSVEEALFFFDRLKELHTKRWQSKGKAGSFANPAWEKFHRSLINERFDAGEIQMLKIANAEQDIAFLYNFCWHRSVYVLQMGFNYSKDKRYKPGYLAHAMAIAHNIDKGMAVYDFMHGESRYKKSLGNRSTYLYWVILQRRKYKFIVENIALGMLRWIRKIIAANNN